MTISEIVKQAQALSQQDRKELIKLLIDSLDVETPPALRRRRLSELRGLGKEIWQDIDAQEYVNRLRDEWDRQQ
ncbi:MAG: hypothetical protein HPY64_14930 [Anaerolineae bacterium]|nr:hypothetical protein [Anaerolineae bacterium]